MIHPPVDVSWIHGGGWRAQLTDADHRVLESLPDEFVLGVSRFIPYNRLDVVMQTGRLLGLPVVIAGHGPLEAQLRAHAAEAGVPVHFEVQPSDALVYALMERARIFVFPPVEDVRRTRGRADRVARPAVRRDEFDRALSAWLSAHIVFARS